MGAVSLSGDDWAAIENLVHIRSGGRCEIRSSACLAGPDGDLSLLPRWRRSLHHRRPRGMGGTSREDVHSLAGLVNACGHGTTGCHWWVERHRTAATRMGLLVPNHGTAENTDVALVPVTLPGGRRVLFDDAGPFYLTVTDGPVYDLTDTRLAVR